MDCAYPLLLFKEEEEEDDLLLFVVVAARKSATEEDVIEEEEDANIIRKARTREWVELCAWCVVFLAFKFEDYSSDALFFYSSSSLFVAEFCVLLTRPLSPRRSERFFGHNSSEEKHRRYSRRTRRAKGAKDMKRTCVLSVSCHGVTSSSIRF